MVGKGGRRGDGCMAETAGSVATVGQCWWRWQSEERETPRWGLSSTLTPFGTGKARRPYGGGGGVGVGWWRRKNKPSGGGGRGSSPEGCSPRLLRAPSSSSPSPSVLGKFTGGKRGPSLLSSLARWRREDEEKDVWDKVERGRREVGCT